MPLHEDAHEVVVLQRWRAGTEVSLHSTDGLELVVLEGNFTAAGDYFRYQSWLRLPPGSVMQAKAGLQGCRVWIKTGHLGKSLKGRTLPL